MSSHVEHSGGAAHAGALQTYYIVFGSLIVLTLLTAGAAVAPFPDWLHTPVALAIAGVKAGLVLLFFMHLRQCSWLVWLVAFGSLLWLAIMLTLTFADYLSRTWIQF